MQRLVRILLSILAITWLAESSAYAIPLEFHIAGGESGSISFSNAYRAPLIGTDLTVDYMLSGLDKFAISNGRLNFGTGEIIRYANMHPQPPIYVFVHTAPGIGDNIYPPYLEITGGIPALGIPNFSLENPTLLVKSLSFGNISASFTSMGGQVDLETYIGFQIHPILFNYFGFSGGFGAALLGNLDLLFDAPFDDSSQSTQAFNSSSYSGYLTLSPIYFPIPNSAILFGSGIMGLIGFRKLRRVKFKFSD
jgi:hypothetical protein